jgi:hypothetical protein
MTGYSLQTFGLNDFGLLNPSDWCKTINDGSSVPGGRNVRLNYIVFFSCGPDILSQSRFWDYRCNADKSVNLTYTSDEISELSCGPWENGTKSFTQPPLPPETID